MRNFLFFLINAFLTINLHAQTSMNILVMPFENLSSKEYSWISAGMTDSVIGDLSKISSMSVISETDRRKVESELVYQRNMGKDSELIQMSLASGLLADVILSGSYTVTGEEIQIIAKLVDVRSGSTVNTAKIRGKLNDLFSLQDQVVIQLFQNTANAKVNNSNVPHIGKSEMQEIAEKPTDRIQAFEYYAKGLEKQDKNPKKALEFYKKAIKVDPDYVQALLSAGFISGFHFDQHGEALKYLNHADEILKQRRKMHTKIYADLMNNEGVIYKTKGELKIALEYYLKSKNIYDVLGYNVTTGYANLLSNIANIYEARGETDRALENYHNAKIIYEKFKLENTDDYAVLLNNMGIAYRQKRDYTQALEYYKRSEKIQDKLGLKKTAGYSDLMNNIGYLYEKKKDPDRALEYYNKSIKIRKKLKLKNTGAFASILMNIGNIHNNRAQYKQAKKYYNNSKNIMEDLDLQNTSSYGNLLYNIALSYDRQNYHNAAGMYYRKAYHVYVKNYGEGSSDAKDADRRADSYGH